MSKQRLGRRERLVKVEARRWKAQCRERADAEVEQVWSSCGGPAPIKANGSGPAYRWPVNGLKCALNPMKRTLITRKAGLRDKLANLKYNGVRLAQKMPL